MTKNWRRKITTEKKIKFFWSKTTIYLSRGLYKGHPSYRRSLQLSKENIQHFKTWNFLIFFYFCGSLALLNLDPDPDSEYGSVSGSTDLIDTGSNTDPDLKPWPTVPDFAIYGHPKKSASFGKARCCTVPVHGAWWSSYQSWNFKFKIGFFRTKCGSHITFFALISFSNYCSSRYRHCILKPKVTCLYWPWLVHITREVLYLRRILIIVLLPS